MQRKKLLPSALLIAQFAALIAFCSCGDYYSVDDGTEQATDVDFGMDRTHLDLMVGDTCPLPVWFSPDTLTDKSLFWQSQNILIATVDNGLVTARRQGTTTITALAIKPGKTAECEVNVIDRWTDFDARQYAYDMVIYGNVTIKGRPIDNDVILAAFIDNEVRGIGQIRQSNGITYTVLRVYSPNGAESTVSLRLYDRQTYTAYDIPQTYTFDGEAHGTLSELEQITIE